jgi:phycocyanobilin lyase subunit alpha
VSRAENAAIQRVRTARRDRDCQYLVNALTDPVVRPWAARYLGKLGAADATPALRRLLDVSDPKARLAAADALAMLGAVEATEDLIVLAECDPDVAVQCHAVCALGALRDARSTPLLVRLLASRSRYVRLSAASALSQFGDDSVLEALRAASRREPFYLRRTYRKAIRRIRKRK